MSVPEILDALEWRLPREGVMWPVAIVGFERSA
jgi:hypothetical protein